jgi:hypothetical protein
MERLKAFKIYCIITHSLLRMPYGALLLIPVIPQDAKREGADKRFIVCLRVYVVWIGLGVE